MAPVVILLGNVTAWYPQGLVAANRPLRGAARRGILKIYLPLNGGLSMSCFRPGSRCPWLLIAAAALMAALVVPACQDEASEDEDVARLAAMKEEILRVVGDAACKEPTDCTTIAFGAKPCGGPWEFLVYSKSSVDEEALQELVTRYNGFNDTLNKRYGWASTCDVAIRPAVGCVDGHCAAVSSE